MRAEHARWIRAVIGVVEQGKKTEHPTRRYQDRPTKLCRLSRRKRGRPYPARPELA